MRKLWSSPSTRRWQSQPVFLRGYSLDHGTDFASSVDSVPVNIPTNAYGQGYSDLNFLIPELVDRINYKKGTRLAQNGDFASAGSGDIQFVHPRKAPSHQFYRYRQRCWLGRNIAAWFSQVFLINPTVVGIKNLIQSNGIGPRCVSQA